MAQRPRPPAPLPIGHYENRATVLALKAASMMARGMPFGAACLESELRSFMQNSAFATIRDEIGSPLAISMEASTDGARAAPEGDYIRVMLDTFAAMEGPQTQRAPKEGPTMPLIDKRERIRVRSDGSEAREPVPEERTRVEAPAALTIPQGAIGLFNGRWLAPHAELTALARQHWQKAHPAAGLPPQGTWHDVAQGWTGDDGLYVLATVDVTSFGPALHVVVGHADEVPTQYEMWLVRASKLMREFGTVLESIPTPTYSEGTPKFLSMYSRHMYGYRQRWVVGSAHAAP